MRLTLKTDIPCSPSYKFILHSLRQTIIQLKQMKKHCQYSQLVDNIMQDQYFFTCQNTPRINTPRFQYD